MNEKIRERVKREKERARDSGGKRYVWSGAAHTHTCTKQLESEKHSWWRCREATGRRGLRRAGMGLV